MTVMRQNCILRIGFITRDGRSEIELRVKSNILYLTCSFKCNVYPVLVYISNRHLLKEASDFIAYLPYGCRIFILHKSISECAINIVYKVTRYIK